MLQEFSLTLVVDENNLTITETQEDTLEIIHFLPGHRSLGYWTLVSVLDKGDEYVSPAHKHSLVHAMHARTHTRSHTRTLAHTLAHTHADTTFYLFMVNIHCLSSTGLLSRLTTELCPCHIRRQPPLVIGLYTTAM
jgi:hypothetical protein